MSTLRKVITGSVIAGLLISTGALPAQAAPKNQARAVVQADWLEQNVDNPKVRIIEVSTEPGIYERGHIKNAAKIVWHTDLVDTVNRDIASAKNFQKLAQKIGINKDTTIVLYGDKNNWFAAWGAWLFNIYGATDVRILDGGRVKWEKDGRALTTAVPAFKAGNFTTRVADKSLRATLLQDVLPVAKKRVKADLIDIRGADEFSGKIFAAPGFQELAVRAGHIPGAENIAWGLNVNADFAAAAIAASLQASSLIVMTDVAGIYRNWPDKGSLIESISASELESIKSGFAEGMAPKVQAALDALSFGAKAVRIIDGTDPDSFASALAGTGGTLVVA